MFPFPNSNPNRMQIASARQIWNDAKEQFEQIRRPQRKGADVAELDQKLPDLPDEILFHIFSYLPHKELLQVRQLNQYWNHFIASSQAIQKSTIFRIGSVNEYSINHNLLTNRMPLSIPWKSVCLDETSFMIQIPLQRELRKVESLYIKQQTQFEWIYAQELLSQLKKLESLYIKIESNFCNLMDNKIEDDQETIDKFHQVIRHLKSLTLIMGSGDSVIFILQKMVPYAHGLEELKIEVGEEYKKNSKICMELYKIIAGSAGTLKVLDIGLYAANTAGRDFCSLVLNQIKLNSIQLNIQQFNLRNVDISRHEDYLVLIDFLSTQPNLISAFIPHFDGLPLKKSISKYLPKTLKKLTMFTSKGLNKRDNVLEYFAELNELEIINDSANGMIELIKKPKGETGDFISFPKLQSLSIQNTQSPDTIVQSLGPMFPNLTKLVLDTIGKSPVFHFGPELWNGVGDYVIQTIAKNLVNLQYLGIKNCSKVTDYGWTGIRKSFLRGLTDEEKENSDFEVPETEMKGVPLSSLKYLRELDIQTSGEISHLAIKYGFNFPEIKRLSIVDFYGSGMSGLDIKSVRQICLQLQTLEHLRLRLTRQLHWEERFGLVKMLPKMVDTTQNFSLFSYHFITPCKSYRNWMVTY